MFKITKYHKKMKLVYMGAGLCTLAFLFLNDDLQTDINVGDIVTFSGEEVHDFKRAFFVKSKSDNVQLSMKVKDNERNNN